MERALKHLNNLQITNEQLIESVKNYVSDFPDDLTQKVNLLLLKQKFLKRKIEAKVAKLKKIKVSMLKNDASNKTFENKNSTIDVMERETEDLNYDEINRESSNQNSINLHNEYKKIEDISVIRNLTSCISDYYNELEIEYGQNSEGNSTEKDIAEQLLHVEMDNIKLPVQIDSNLYDSVESLRKQSITSKPEDFENDEHRENVKHSGNIENFENVEHFDKFEHIRLKEEEDKRNVNLSVEVLRIRKEQKKEKLLAGCPKSFLVLMFIVISIVIALLSIFFNILILN